MCSTRLPSIDVTSTLAFAGKYLLLANAAKTSPVATSEDAPDYRLAPT